MRREGEIFFGLVIAGCGLVVAGDGVINDIFPFGVLPLIPHGILIWQTENHFDALLTLMGAAKAVAGGYSFGVGRERFSQAVQLNSKEDKNIISPK